LSLLLTSLPGQSRTRQSFNSDWLFCLGDSATMSSPDYADSHWRKLDLPHDWAIEGDFFASNPSGAGGGALPGGVGWYRKHFQASPSSGERCFIEFDGVYMNATVWVNGHRLGTRPYGYISYEYELTPYLRKGDNVISVRVDNSDQPNSRWYSGCGIYRNVWLTTTRSLRIAHWGVYVVPQADGRLSVNVTLDDAEHTAAHPMVRNVVRDARGKIVARQENGRFTHNLRVRRPQRWSVSRPYVYHVTTSIIVGGEVVDSVTTTTAFRDFRFDAKTGFWLNGENMKINGVCLHHDQGCLGAALNTDALHRQLVKMKEMGVNAIRCSHNPPSPELLNMCDTMGFIVMDESFDMWRQRKTKNDYARFFDQWFERDLTDLVLRDRNHPSILMWSIGNEVLEQWNNVNADNLSLEEANLILNAGHGSENLSADTTLNFNQKLTWRLADIVRRLDPTRPITAGCNEPSPDNNLFKSGALDLIGFNYHRQWIKDVPHNFPGKPFLLTESVSALQTRGFYRMPSDSIFIMPKRWDLPYTDPSMMCSAYDNSHASWSSTHEETWDIVKHTPYVSGQFIWTGFDYIGEPTPYGFPARSSYFGIVDLAGFPKDVYYMYQSEWTSRRVLHLFPHWNWVEGQTVDMWCYYNQADEVELFVNGKSQGVRRKTPHTYHVAWRVTYEPGEVKVVARQQGRQVAQQTIRTAGAPEQIRLTMDYKGDNTYFIRAEVTDSEGNLCPWAEDDIHFSVTNGTIAGVDNGSQFSMERFQSDHRKAFFGRALVVVRVADSSRPVTVTAKSAMLRTAEEKY
jgi:beta-galactosidase